MTAINGATFDPGYSYNSRFAHAYVSLSRCSTCNKMTEPPYYTTTSLLGMLSTDHFSRHLNELNMIKQEYRRLEALTAIYQPNALYI